MAGPGGGAPRRSHTKSRKGCKTCKKRHIRCDESFPQCRNCTKHNCRCDYMDAPSPVETSPKTTPRADLLWTPEVEREVELWRAGGSSPFPETPFHPQTPVAEFSSSELRLIHHLAAVSRQMESAGTSSLTLWAPKIPTFLRLASSYGFVLHSVLALSATHLAWITECPLTSNFAYQHRGIALKGLQEAIGHFSRENADAVLAATMLLSFQATEWNGWHYLMQGTTSVIDAMRPWKDSSSFADFMEQKAAYSRALASISPEGHGGRDRGRKEIAALQRLYVSLQRAEAYLNCSDEESRGLNELTSFVRTLLAALPVRATPDQFELLRSLRPLLLWLPVTILEHGEKSVGSLIVLAHYHAVGLIVEGLFPAVGGACFGSMSVGPMGDIGRYLEELRLAHADPGVPDPTSLVELPLEMMSKFRACMADLQHSGPAYSPVHLEPDAYGVRGLKVEMGFDPAEQAGPFSYPAYSQSGDGTHATVSPALSDPGPPGMLPHGHSHAHVHDGSLRGPLEGYQLDAYAGLAGVGPSHGYVDHAHARAHDHRHGMGAMEFTDALSASTLWSR
ncbi:MAG: hypothetical protein M1832_005048 [Thelocarpon impressellum]|nr:MAG: hypothetical protein M1832_005048 [Thelocarpon impressellum]